MIGVVQCLRVSCERPRLLSRKVRSSRLYVTLHSLVVSRVDKFTLVDLSKCYICSKERKFVRGCEFSKYDGVPSKSFQCKLSPAKPAESSEGVLWVRKCERGISSIPYSLDRYEDRPVPPCCEAPSFETLMYYFNMSRRARNRTLISW